MLLYLVGFFCQTDIIEHIVYSQHFKQLNELKSLLLFFSIKVFVINTAQMLTKKKPIKQALAMASFDDI